VSTQGRSVLTVEQANLALTVAFDASAVGGPIEFVIAPESRSDAADFRRPPLHLQLSQLKRIHALRIVSGEGDSASVSATVAALEDACTDADSFETICQIRGDKEDDADNVNPTSLFLVPSPVASSSSFLPRIYALPFGNNLTITRGKKLSASLVLPHLVPQCWVPIGITPLSRVELVKLACAVMV
jgi:hypothetical protein